MPIHLDAARINARLTQAEVAKELKISRNTLSSYESYTTSPDIETAKKLATLYNLSLDDIIWSA